MAKQWASTWPYVVNAVLELYKIMVKKATFLDFGGRLPPPGSVPVYNRQNLEHWKQNLLIVSLPIVLVSRNNNN